MMERKEFKQRYHYAQAYGFFSLIFMTRWRLKIVGVLGSAYYFCPEIYLPFALDMNHYKVVRE